MKNLNKNLAMCVDKLLSYQSKKIFISKNVMDIFKLFEQQTECSTEACGILMCSIEKDSNSVYINYATTPHSNDIRKYSYFFLKDEKHQRELNLIHKKSDGTVFLCGTWHTHPEDKPVPSKLDIDEWKRFAQGNHGLIENFYFIIVGKKDIVLYTLIDKNIVLIN